MHLLVHPCNIIADNYAIDQFLEKTDRYSANKFIANSTCFIYKSY